MDRLISEQAVIDAVSEWLYDKTRKESIETVIKAIPSAEPYKGMTNGQVHDMLYQMLVELKDGADRYGAEKWWNSPYEPQEKRCADCNHYGKLSLDCGRCDDDCSMFEPQERSE